MSKLPPSRRSAGTAGANADGSRRGSSDVHGRTSCDRLRLRAAAGQPGANNSLALSVTHGRNRTIEGTTELNRFCLAVQYTCVEGDTWESVGREFRLGAETLRTFNKSATLEAGLTIDLRGSDVPQLGAGGSYSINPDGTATYIVKAEDTLSGISSRFGVPGYALRGANPSLCGNGAELLVAPGQKLTIPSTV